MLQCFVYILVKYPARAFFVQSQSKELRSREVWKPRRAPLGVWSLALGVWSLEFGAWSLELGVWSLELGAWSLEFGWSLPCYGGGAVGGVHGPDRARGSRSVRQGQKVNLLPS